MAKDRRVVEEVEKDRLEVEEEGEGGEEEEFGDKRDGIEGGGRREAIEKLLKTLDVKVEVIEVKRLREKGGKGEK